MGAWSDRYGESMERSIGEQYERDQSETVEVLFLCRKLRQEKRKWLNLSQKTGS